MTSTLRRGGGGWGAKAKIRCRGGEGLASVLDVQSLFFLSKRDCTMARHYAEPNYKKLYNIDKKKPSF